MAKIRALPAADRWLLVRALAAVIAVRVRLKLRPFRPGMDEARVRNVRHRAQPSPDRIAWAVDRVSNRVGNATCLVRALAAHAMLGRDGFSSSVRIGVVAGDPRDKGKNLIAHAWVESGGRVLLGGPDVSRYTPLLAWSN